MKLLVVASSLDLRVPLSSTPSWWQLLKALAEQGVELVVAPYQGPPIETPWWTAAANPCQHEGDAVGWLKAHDPMVRRSRVPNLDERMGDRLTRVLVDRVTRPRWRRHLLGLIESQRTVDAVLFLTVPPNHFSGIPGLIQQRFGIPTYFYDGDVPASLPRFAGFKTGFRIYEGADLSEYACVFSSSKGGIDDLIRLGARQTRVLYYAADPVLFAPDPATEQDIDVFFYGHGGEYREHWIDAMLAEPSQRLADLRFAARGTHLGALPRVEMLPYASFSSLKVYCRRSRVNLLITRQAHASVFGSSTARPFELAALGCAMVSNPYIGIEEWFEPDLEVVLVSSAQEAMEAYRRLAASPAERHALGERARARLLAEHTYAHRAAELRSVLSANRAA